jgi:hypothetical protein
MNSFAQPTLRKASLLFLHILNLIPIILVAMASRSLSDLLGWWVLLPALAIVAVLVQVTIVTPVYESVLGSYGSTILLFTAGLLADKYFGTKHELAVQHSPIAWYFFYFILRFENLRK